MYPFIFISFFFFNDTATTEIYTLSLHDALPISRVSQFEGGNRMESSAAKQQPMAGGNMTTAEQTYLRSEEHTSELQSHSDLVCRLLLEKKKINSIIELEKLRIHIDSNHTCEKTH